MIPFRKYLILSIFFIVIIIIGCKSNNNLDSATDIDFEFFLEPQVTDGFVRLIMFEKTSSFSLSYVPDATESVYEPLFANRNPRSSYMSISIDGKIHRLGRSRAFKSSVERIDGDPAFVFESKDITVTQVFTPVKTPNSNNTNGIKITITVYNNKPEDVMIGLRFLLDTVLGEKKGLFPFVTESQIITSETQIDRSSGERYWMSRGNNLSLMGSIFVPDDETALIPDLIHFANWKRLNDTPWKLKFSQGRSFSYFPYSINDSAVCYYYDPLIVYSEGSYSYIIYLTTQDSAWYHPHEPEKRYIIRNMVNRTISILTLSDEEFNEVKLSNPNIERMTLPLLREVLNQFVLGELVLTRSDIDEIENYIYAFRN